MLQMKALYASIYFNPPSYYLTPQYTLILLHTMLTNPSTICLMPYALLPKPYASCLAYQAHLWQCDADRHPLLLHTNTIYAVFTKPSTLRLTPYTFGSEMQAVILLHLHTSPQVSGFVLLYQ